MLFLFLLALSFFSPATEEDDLRPPQASPAQRTRWQQKAVVAEAASRSATPELLDLLSSPACRSQITRSVPDVASLSSEDLLQRIRSEIRVAELFTGLPAAYGEFDSAPLVACGLPNVTLASSSSYHYNIWRLTVERKQLPICSSPVHEGQQVIEDKVQQKIFGCPGFSGGMAHPKTVAEATDRIVYLGWNVRKLDMSQCPFGSISLIVSRPYARGLAMVTPVDTGFYNLLCLNSVSPSAPPPYGGMNCSGWPDVSVVGTMDHFDHTLLARARLEAVGEVSASQALGAFVERLLAPRKTTLRTNLGLDMFGYFEVGLTGNLLYPDGVQLALAHFPVLFGTTEGLQLLAWSQHYRWPIAWTFGIIHTDALCIWDGIGNGTVASFSEKRLLDPRAANGTTNASLPGDAVERWQALWTEVATARKQETPSDDEWHAWWRRAADILGAGGQVWPQVAGHCLNSDDTFGMDALGRCLTTSQTVVGQRVSGDHVTLV